MDINITFLNYLKYMQKSLYFAIPAIVLGLLIDNLFTKLQDEYSSRFEGKIGNFIFGVSQLLIVITTIYIIENYIGKEFISLLQETTSGLIFASLYYGSNVNMFNNFSKLLEF